MLGEKERKGNKGKEKGGRRQGEENKMEKINHTKSNQKKTCEAIIIPDKLNFKSSSGSLQKDKRVKFSSVAQYYRTLCNPKRG